MAMRSWLHEVFVALDQLGNAILAGWADETISARSYRLGLRDVREERWGRWRVMRAIVDVLFIPQDVSLLLRSGTWPPVRHCQRAYQSEQQRLGLPPEYRT